MQHAEGSGTPVLYIGRTVLKGLIACNIEKVTTKYPILAGIFLYYFVVSVVRHFVAKFRGFASLISAVSDVCKYDGDASTRRTLATKVHIALISMLGESLY